MGFFRRLFGGGNKQRQVSDGPSVEQISYTLAYSILPHGAHNEPSRIQQLWNEPDTAGLVLYHMACQAVNAEPDARVGAQYKIITQECEGNTLFILEYPPPSPHNPSGMDPLKAMESGQMLVLAPYFSCVCYDSAGGSANLFILGQSPMEGMTTLRSVSASGTNANLGPGPEPVLSAFIEAVKNQLRHR